MSPTRLQLSENRLSLDHPDWSRETFEVSEEDYASLKASTDHYQQLLTQRGRHQEALLNLGTQLTQWLNRSGWLNRLLEEVDVPWEVIFQVPRCPNPNETTFLNAPWELLVWQKKHLAVDIDVRFNPIRQIGIAKNTLAPSDYRLSLMFMAAAPEKVSRLSYEAEELAILEATQDRNLDLAVEETGTLTELATEVARYEPDVIHISCHGGFDAQENQVLLLEDEEGFQAETHADHWLGQLSLTQIKLAFISACHTANPSPQLADSLASQLIKGGIPAVLGWGNTVSDREASQFAQYFYQFLAQHQSLSQAVGAARWQLFTHKPNSQDWHLARLFLGRYQVDALTVGDKARRLLDAELGAKAFLDKNKQVPVAGRAEFVGRRRALQQIIRAFRRPQQAGVLIHGMGRQGKSSLAARIARRLVHYQTAVVYKHYDALDILLAFKNFSPTINQIVNHYEPFLKTNPHQLSEALQQLLNQTEQPILLVIDDLEQILDPPPTGSEGLYTIRTDLQVVFRALLSSFNRWVGQSPSRLLLTSRYRFVVPDDRGENLADKLLQWPLAPMDKNEQWKQLEQKQRFLNHHEKRDFEADWVLQARCLKLAQGNPGLQDQLYHLICQNAEVAKQTLDELETWLTDQTATVQEEQTRDLLEGLVLDKLYGLLSEEAQQLFQWSQDLVMPLPINALNHLASATAVQSLLTLGLWDGWRDDLTLQPTALLNRLAQRLAQALSTDQQKVIAQKLLPPLWAIWQETERSHQADYQLTRLAVRIADTVVLDQVAGTGVYWAKEKISFTEGKQLGLQAIAQLEQAGLTPDNLLLRFSAESCQRVGAEGDIDKAFELHQRRLALLPTEKAWERAIAYGGIADILQARGQLDEALRLRENELLPVYERLGDVRSRAVTIRKIADILQLRGELDEAFRLLNEEALPAVEKLGSIADIAVFKGRIADNLQARGQLDEALRLRETEELPVYERLGDVRERAVTLGKIADILQARGQLDEALRLQKEEVLPICERLDDMQGLLVTQTNIAIILMQFDPPRRDEANQWFCQALHAAQQMRLPEAAQIEAILQQFEMEC